jgi:hypothetical protein
LKKLLEKHGITIPDDKRAAFEADFAASFERVASSNGFVAAADAERHKTAASFEREPSSNVDWKKKYEDETAAFAAHKRDAALTTALAAHKPRNAGLLKKALDISAIKFKEDGAIEGLTEQIDALKKSDAYLFEPAAGSGESHDGQKSGGFGFSGNSFGRGSSPNWPAGDSVKEQIDAGFHALFS